MGIYSYIHFYTIICAQIGHYTQNALKTHKGSTSENYVIINNIFIVSFMCADKTN